VRARLKAHADLIARAYYSYRTDPQGDHYRRYSEGDMCREFRLALNEEFGNSAADTLRFHFLDISYVEPELVRLYLVLEQLPCSAATIYEAQQRLGLLQYSEAYAPAKLVPSVGPAPEIFHTGFIKDQAAFKRNESLFKWPKITPVKETSAFFVPPKWAPLMITANATDKRLNVAGRHLFFNYSEKQQGLLGY